MEAGLRLARRFLRDHPAEAARVIEKMEAREAAALLADEPPEAAILVWRSLAPTAAAESLGRMEIPSAVALLCRASASRAAVALRRMSLPVRSSLLAACPDPWRGSLERACAAGPFSVGAFMDPAPLEALADWTVGEAREFLAARPDLLRFDLFVVDRDWRLVGRTDLGQIGAYAGERAIAAVMRPEPERLAIRAALAAIREDPLWRRFDALPVVDESGLLAGTLQHRSLRSWTTKDASSIEPATALVVAAELAWTGYLAAIDVASSWGGSLGETEIQREPK